MSDENAQVSEVSEESNVNENQEVSEESESSAAESESVEVAAEEAEEVVVPELTEAQIEKLLEGRKFKTKVDGEEEEVDLHTLISERQRAAASNKRFQEAAEIRKQNEEFQKLLRDNPEKALKDMELDPHQLAEKWLAEKFEEQMLPPEEREKRELQREKKALEEQIANIRAQEEAKKQKELEDQYVEEYTRSLNAALEKSPLPNDQMVINRIVDYVQQADNMGYEISMAEAVRLVENDYRNSYQPIFKDANVDYLVGLLGEDMVKAIREYDASRVKNPKGEAAPKESQAPAKTRETAPKKPAKNFDDFWKKFDN
jgi:hypothetical protein